MPVTRIAISEQRFACWHAQISMALQQSLECHFSVPVGDCFQLFDCYSPQRRVFNPDYLCGGDGRRSDDFLLFQITAGKARSRQQKQRFYQDLTNRLEQLLGISPQNMMIVIGYTEPEDWSFGSGKMFCLTDIPQPQ
ncbi:tautomerase family protein [Klebsiella sp. I138]|uniref:tautomerase family protein n=1 Tax=Klebsiella sp. I138 TaxID=2755385 RepID=UPI003DA84254